MSFRPRRAESPPSGEILRDAYRKTNAFAVFGTAFAFCTRSLRSVARFSHSLGRDDRGRTPLFRRLCRHLPPRGKARKKPRPERLLLSVQDPSARSLVSLTPSVGMTEGARQGRDDRGRTPLFRRLCRHLPPRGKARKKPCSERLLLSVQDPSTDTRDDKKHTLSP